MNLFKLKKYVTARRLEDKCDDDIHSFYIIKR